jgi:hypothetical protein
MSWSGVPELIEERFFGEPRGPEFERAWSRLWARVGEQQARRERSVMAGNAQRAAAVRLAAEFTD